MGRCDPSPRRGKRYALRGLCWGGEDQVQKLLEVQGGADEMAS